MSTMTISKNRAAMMNNKTVNVKTTFVERFKKYIMDNADYFAASSAILCGNSAAVVQIMKSSKGIA